MEAAGFVDVELGPRVDTFGGAPGEQQARQFGTVGSPFLARRPAP
jgi:arsenite methyltransferase